MHGGTNQYYYPTASLRKAAESFRDFWLQSANRQGSWAHRIHCMNMEHPPQLRVLYELPNPHDSPMMMPNFNAGLNNPSQSQRLTDNAGLNNPSQSQRLTDNAGLNNPSQSQRLSVNAGLNNPNQSQLQTLNSGFRNPIQSDTPNNAGFKDNPNQSRPPANNACINNPIPLRSPTLNAGFNNPSPLQQPTDSVVFNNPIQLHQQFTPPQFDGPNQSYIYAPTSHFGIVKVLPQAKAPTPCSAYPQSADQPGPSGITSNTATHQVQLSASSTSANQSAQMAVSGSNHQSQSSLLGKRSNDATQPMTASRSEAQEALENQTTQLQCDTCGICRNTRKVMLNHMSSNGHPTASECTNVGNNELIISVPNRLILGPSGRSSDLEILCPVCHLPIGCRFACGLHHSLEHQTGREMWAARPVLARRVVQINPENVCPSGRCENSQTGIAFPSANQLNSHWRSQPNCCPVSQMIADATAAGSGMMLLIVECTRCLRVFLSRIGKESGNQRESESVGIGAFCAARAHAVDRHPDCSKNNGPRLSLSTTLVDLLGGRIARVPPVKCSADSALGWSLRVAQSLAQLTRRCSSRRTQMSKRLQAHLAGLRQCRGGAGTSAEAASQEDETDDFEDRAACV